MPQASVDYDFAAADDLESTLNQASAKLGNLMTQRGIWAGSYLTYMADQGQLQGWIGTEYSKWATQFNESQRMIVGFITDMAQQAYTVHNISYTQETANFVTTQRRPMSRPATAPPIISAPVNNPGPGNPEGATPGNLYRYSDLSTGLNDQIRPFFAKSLAAAFADQPSANTALYGNSFRESSNLPARITWFLRWQLLELDARVRIVGEAFELADKNKPDSVTQFISLPSGYDGESEFNTDLYLVTSDTTNAQQAAQNLKQMEQSTGLNFSLVLQELRENEDNPVWTTAFFSSLSKHDIEVLLNIMDRNNAFQGYTSDLAQAYTTALNSGEMPNSAISDLIDVFLSGDKDGIPTGKFDSDLLKDLNENPAAATTFLNNASDQQLLQMLNGDYSLPSSNSGEREAQIIDLFSVFLANNPSGADAAFYDRVTKLIFQTDPDPAAPVLAAAQVFLSQYIIVEFPPPPGDPAELTQWAEDAGTWINSLENGGPDGGWHGWIKQFEQSNHQHTAQAQSNFENIAGASVSILETVLEGLQPELIPPAVLLGASVGSGGLSAWLAEKIYPGTFDGDPATDPETMDSSVKYTAEFMVAFELIARGEVKGPGGDPVTFTSSADLKTVLDHADQYTVAGDPNLKLSSFMNDAGNQINPPKPPPPGVKWPGG